MLPPFSMGLGELGQRESVDALDRFGGLDRIRLPPANGRRSRSLQSSVAKSRNEQGIRKSLGSVLNRPAFMSVPAPILRLMFGEFANEGLLSSCRAHPAKLQSSGYHFKYPNVDDALRLTLGRFPEGSSK